ncbi:ATP-grasp domain-containing protein [Actinokineospora globicatena]|uniref:ATP-grasp domain-containing protein n=1 Tax=Actinokineospora globicatena TaxID=103729 RepID=UPI0020A2758B|nr:ATP-grasp domain-containing protein [Actinokineospora globicatena]MCP2305972.1 Biotin carboxylase [Actinokineospora globicatena]GLW80157.1 argininosuccinate lyase [Actinokineospora globicatena]GLW86986.1 argininosuccinate lyase [Actinokineospora globicatena]
MTVVLLEALTFGLGRLAEAAHEAGHGLVLLTGDRSIYRHELSGVDSSRGWVVDVDTTDVRACEAALLKVPDLAGLISSTDTWAIPGAELAALLGLPGPSVDAVRVLRDKGLVRERLHERGLSRGGLVAHDEFPLVLKDSAGTSSRGVWLVRGPEELAAALAEAAVTPLRGRLVAEPYFEGPLYSAETITWEGRTRLLGVLSRQLSPEPVRREEAAAFPVAFPEAELAELADWIGRVLEAAGHDRGFAHTEFILTADGPEVVEINPRIGGALVGESLCRALGVNVYRDMVAMALGEEPALLSSARREVHRATAFVLLYPSTPGTLTGWSGLERLPALPGSPEWYPTAVPGQAVDHLADQRSCTGIVLAEAPTAELALHRALSAAGGITPLIATKTG